MIYVKQCPKCGSTNLGGYEDELKQCLSCGALWFEPIPNSPQQRFLQCSVREVGFGGEAGGSKSFSLILDPVYQLAKKDYHALLLRRTYKQLTGDDGLVELSKKVYPAIGGHYVKSEYLWVFADYPGTIRFGHIEYDKNLEQDHEGHQYAYLGFDELQTFTERMYLYLFSRNRSSNPDVRLFTRSTFMPGGIGHFWVKKRFIDTFKNGNGYTKKPKFFRRISGADTEVDSSDQYATGRLFIPARLEDNPYLYQDGRGEYEKGLHQLDTVDFARKRGDWDIRRTGRVYHAFSDKNIGPDSRNLDYSKVAGYYHSHDFGAVHHIWGLWAKIDSKYYLIHEEQLPEGTTANRADRIKKVWRKTVQYLVEEFINDGIEPEKAIEMALSKIIAGWGGAAGETQFRRDFGQEGVIIRLPDVTKGVITDQLVNTQVRRTNDMFDNEQLMICSDMVMTLDQLENCVRDENEGIENKSKWHYCDMSRYFAAGIKSSNLDWGFF